MTTAEFLEQEILERTGFRNVMDVPMEKYNRNDSSLVIIKRLIGSTRMNAMRIKDNKHAYKRSELALSIKLP